MKVAGPCLRGEKVICLAITEPEAGSDVAKITTEAKLSPCGKCVIFSSFPDNDSFYTVNGTKKWITNGIYADYFTTIVRTGDEGRTGISVLVIERGPGLLITLLLFILVGVTTRQMDCMGLTGSGTTFVTFEDVKVPVGNLLGKRNQGFRIIMHNFNHER